MLVVYVSYGSVHSPIPLLTMLFITVAIVVYWALIRNSWEARRAKEEARIARIRAASRPGRRR
jgi:cytochrome c oxidase assembly factor CtaG